jgi:hypothetical protein
MRLAADRREHSLCLSGALGGYSKSLPRSAVIPTLLAQVPGRPQTLLGGEFRVSSIHLLCGVSLPGGGTGGVGVDERVEGASKRHTGFVLLDVDQVERAAQICPLVEPDGSVAGFDDPNQASDEVEAVRTVIPLAVSSVDLQGNWLVHAFSSLRGSGREGGGSHGRTRAVTETLTPRSPGTVKQRRTLH